MPLSCIVIGAGQRGTGYALYALEAPDKLKVVGVAEPREFRRQRLQRDHDIPRENVLSDWTELLSRPKFADFVIIATQDRDHKDPAIAMARLRYHIMLEKPMAVTEEDCRAIKEACEENCVKLCVCHVLRYTPANRKIKELIDEGAIGDVVNIQHKEPVGYFHFAHSFVRGNWRREDTSTFALLAKSCHDVDLIRYWMGRQCSRVSSFGSLQHFRRDRAPPNAGKRCVSCPQQVEQECPYSAKKIYLEAVKRGNTHWPVSVITDEPTEESVMRAIEDGPYGRCVYACDNDVVDNQVVNFEFDGGATASFTMVAFTESICQRETYVYGTHGEISCRSERQVSYVDFRTGKKTTLDVEGAPAHTKLHGHGGADYYLMSTFVDALIAGKDIPTSAADAYASHRLVFRAEEARHKGQVVSMDS